MTVTKKRIAICLVTVLGILLLVCFIFHKSIAYYFSYEIKRDYEVHDDHFSRIHAFERRPNVAHVKMVKLKHNLIHAKRSEYVFEVLDWLKGGNGERQISVYSEKRKGKAWGEIECISYVSYEQGKEYIISFSSDGGFYKLSASLYCPLDDYKNSARAYGVEMYHHLIEDDKMPPELSKEEFIEYARYLSNKTYFTFDEFMDEWNRQKSDPKTKYPFADDGTSLVQVRLTEQIRNDAETEYRFEIIRWLRGGEGETDINVYLDNDYFQSYSYAIFEDFDYYEMKYEDAGQYIVKIKKENGNYRLCCELFCDLSKSSDASYINFMSFSNLDSEKYPGVPNGYYAGSSAYIEKVYELSKQALPAGE